MTLLRRLRREEGELGLVSALLLLAGVLLPIMFIIVAFARIENGRLAAAQAARDAVRAAGEAPTATGAQQAADDAIARAEMQSGVPLQLQLDGTFARGAVVHAQTSAHSAGAKMSSRDMSGFVANSTSNSGFNQAETQRSSTDSCLARIQLSKRHQLNCERRWRPNSRRRKREYGVRRGDADRGKGTRLLS